MIPVIAHGLGDAADLPLPLPLVLIAAGGAVLGLGTALVRRSDSAATSPRPATAVAARPAPGTRSGSRATPGPAVREPAEGRPGMGRRLALPAWVTILVDEPLTRAGLRIVGLLGALLVLALAAFGPVDGQANPAPRLVLLVVWAGLVPLSLVAPGAWRTLSPLRTLTSLLARMSGDPKEGDVRPLPRGLGWWPAAGALAVLAVVEGPLRGELPVLLIFLVAYGLTQVGLAAVYGSRWYGHAEAFEVLAAVVGRLSPFARGADGRLELCNPMPRLAAPAPPGAVLVAGILIGSALADFVTDTPAWSGLALGRTGLAAIGLETAALACCVAVATAVAAAAASARPLTPALLPPVTGYLIAHYFAVFLIEGQAGLSQLSAIAQGGLRTLTTANLVARYDLLPGPLAASGQLLGFLVPHLIGVLVGHRLAVTSYGPQRARAAQRPLLGMLAISAVAGIALRYSAA
ncbi:MAG: hypothetical protein GEU81_03795 [Nitriliruptorales bacterium]|nr:hypothetical protein [Nitriliruptorales bacterium]